VEDHRVAYHDLTSTEGGPTERADPQIRTERQRLSNPAGLITAALTAAIAAVTVAATESRLPTILILICWVLGFAVVCAGISAFRCANRPS
jgi:hypothetical protein